MRRPVSTLPKVWIGFLFAASFLIVEFMEGANGYENGFSPLLFIISLTGIVSTGCSVCIGFTKILRQLDSSYEISPGAAVGYHFLPFKENNQVEVSFSNIITAVLIKDGRRQVIFEGIYVWDMEKRDDDWEIIGISVYAGEKK